MHILITGATGFIGSRLCEAHAARGDRIRALVLPGEDDAHIRDHGAERREGDITDRRTLDGVAEGCDVVYHLAARVLDYGSRDAFYGPILTGTRNLLDATAGAAGRFVLVSSICACGTGRQLRGLTEADPCEDTGVFYGDAKLAAEGVARRYGPRFPRGVVIARPSNVVGPGSVWVREVGQSMQKGLAGYFDGGRHGAGLVSVHNLVDGLVRCGTLPAAAGQTYFFCDDWGVPWKRYLDDLAGMLGAKIRLDLPFPLAWHLGGLLERLAGITRRRPVFTRHSVGLLGRDCDVDTTKARTELGWTSRVAYAEAMAEIRTWVEENLG